MAPHFMILQIFDDRMALMVFISTVEHRMFINFHADCKALEPNYDCEPVALVMQCLTVHHTNLLAKTISAALYAPLSGFIYQKV